MLNLPNRAIGKKVRLYGHAFKNDDCTDDQSDFIIDNYGISTVEKRHVRGVLLNTSSSWPTWVTESTNVTLDAAVSGCQTSERVSDHVFNNSGQIMLTGHILDGRATVNLSHFNKGFYLIKVTGESSSQIRKVFKN